MTTPANGSRRIFLCGLAAALASGPAFSQSRAQSSARPGLQFDNLHYLHRWSKDGQHEFTPKAEPDLKLWTSMVTINRHRAARNGEQLAGVANRILGNYRQHGRIIKAASKPATASQPAEHMIVVSFVRPDFVEMAFTRLALANGAGFALTYSRRIHGQAAGSQMSDWLNVNGNRVERALVGWSDPATLAVYAAALPES